MATAPDTQEASARRWARRAFSLADFERLARRRLPAALYGFAANGAEDGLTVAGNREAFRSVWLESRGLEDISRIDLATRVFGESYSAPFGVAPMGGVALFGHRADLSLAVGARRQGLPFILSAASSVALEEVAERAPGSWYQAYLPGDTARIDSLLDRLRRAAFEALVLTIDVPVSANRDADRRRGFEIPFRPTPGLAIDGLLHPRWLFGTLARTLASGGAPRLCNMQGDGVGNSIFAAPTPAMRTGRDRFTWEHVAHIRRRWNGPLLLKGVLSAEVASRAAALGVDGLIVSNHGGRQLDGALPSLVALGRVREAAPHLMIGLDGGVRRGTDVVKAMALGADLVFLGRPFLYAAAVGADVAVSHAATLLRMEMTKALGLLGHVSPARIPADCVRLQGSVPWEAGRTPAGGPPQVRAAAGG